MRQESHSQGGKREGAGRKAAVPVGGGAVRALNLRAGQDLLDELAARWPEHNDSERTRAAMWAAAGVEVVGVPGLLQARAAFSPEETAAAERLLALLRAWGVECDPSGVAPLGVQLERAFDVVDNAPPLLERLKAEGHSALLHMLVHAARTRRERGRKLLRQAQ